MPADPIKLPFGPQDWDSWSPHHLADVLGGTPARWFVIGGWALDLHHGRQTRHHDDLEIAVPMWDFDLVRERLIQYQFYVAGREGFWPVEQAGEAFFEYQQTLVRDPATALWRLDVMRIPDNRTDWICSIDRSIHRPFEQAISHNPDGIPYLRPEAVLLYKAPATRPKDQSDFEATAPSLSTPARVWLRDALLRVCGPTHPWIPLLEETT